VAGADERISAEGFEALLFMALNTRKAPPPPPPSASARSTHGRSGGAGSRDTKAVPLAAAYEPDNPAPLIAAMVERVGPLLGSPPPAPAATEQPDDVAGLLTPVRGLQIS
jgi:hypothetical protein